MEGLSDVVGKLFWGESVIGVEWEFRFFREFSERDFSVEIWYMLVESEVIYVVFFEWFEICNFGDEVYDVIVVFYKFMKVEVGVNFG